jgi:hypothetical protein
VFVCLCVGGVRAGVRVLAAVALGGKGWWREQDGSARGRHCHCQPAASLWLCLRGSVWLCPSLFYAARYVDVCGAGCACCFGVAENGGAVSGSGFWPGWFNVYMVC